MDRERGRDWEEKKNTSFKRAKTGDRCIERGVKKKKEDRRAVCLLWIICVGSVCVFQLWIVDYAKNSWACLSVSVSLLCLYAGEDCKLLSEVENSASDRPVTNPLSTPRQPRLTGLRRSICSSKTYTLQQQWAGCDLAAIKQLHPSWSLCSS